MGEKEVVKSIASILEKIYSDRYGMNVTVIVK